MPSLLLRPSWSAGATRSPSKEGFAACRLVPNVTINLKSLIQSKSCTHNLYQDPNDDWSSWFANSHGKFRKCDLYAGLRSGPPCSPPPRPPPNSTCSSVVSKDADDDSNPILLDSSLAVINIGHSRKSLLQELTGMLTKSITESQAYLCEQMASTLTAT